MKKNITWGTAIVLLALSVACAAPASIQTAPGKTAYTADQVVQRVNELENATIQAQSANAIDLQTARLIVTFAIAADKVLADTPIGWQTSITTGWAEVKRQLPMITNPSVAAAVGVVDVAVATLGGVR